VVAESREAKIAAGQLAKIEETGLGALLSQLAGTSFDAHHVGEWAGRLAELQYEHLRLVARMLQAALEATNDVRLRSRRHNSDPSGSQTPYCDSALSASQAAIC